jgi:hypothetical protein
MFVARVKMHDLDEFFNQAEQLRGAWYTSA